MHASRLGYKGVKPRDGAVVNRKAKTRGKGKFLILLVAEIEDF